MRFDFCIVLFALMGATQAADSSANQLCGSKEDCEFNCENGEYHTESFKGSTYYACVLDKPVKYAIGACVALQGDPDQHPVKPGRVRDLCETMNGQICNSHSCIFIQTESSIRQFQSGCSKLRVGHAMNYDVSYERLRSSCSRLWTSIVNLATSEVL